MGEVGRQSMSEILEKADFCLFVFFFGTCFMLSVNGYVKK